MVNINYVSTYSKPLKGDWKMRCPKCGYSYELQSEYYEWENCPNCPYGAPLTEFIVKEVTRDEASTRKDA